MGNFGLVASTYADGVPFHAIFLVFESICIFDIDLLLNKMQASPITIGDRPAVVEEKRTTTRGKL